MKKDPTQLRDAATQVRLTETERAQMKASFVSYMDMHTPAEAKANIPSALHNMGTFRLAFAAFVPILLIVAVSFASEASLPNEALYRVKTDFTEALLLKSASFSPQAYAQAETFIVKRRLLEAEQLLFEDKLGPDAIMQLSRDISEHVASIHEYAEDSALTTALDDAVDINRDLENALDASGTVFDTIMDNDPSRPDDGAESFVMEILAHGSSTADLGTTLEQALVAADSAELQVYTRDLELYVTDTFVLLDKELDDVQSESSDPLIMKAHELRQRALNAQASSTAYRQNGEIGNALSQLQDALQYTDQAIHLLSSDERLDETHGDTRTDE